MDIATKNSDCMIGWPTVYAPYSKYKIVGDQPYFSGDKMDVDRNLLIRETIKGSLDNSSQSGGGIKEIKNFRLSSKNIKDGFEQLERRVDNYFRKNNLDNGEKELYLTLKSLDDSKIFIKKYRKKNI